MSQNDKILSYLRTHDDITSLDAYREIGCTRLAARISDLKARGYRFNVTSKTVLNRDGEKVRVAAYGLEEE